MLTNCMFFWNIPVKEDKFKVLLLNKTSKPF